MSEQTTERADAVDSVTFIKKYLPLQKAGKTREQIAKEIGMKLGSFNTKLSTLRTEIFVANSVLSIDGKEVKGDEYVKSHADKVDDDGKPTVTYRTVQNAIKSGDIEVLTHGPKLPMPKNSRQRVDREELGSLVAELMGSVDDDDAEE